MRNVENEHEQRPLKVVCPRIQATCSRPARSSAVTRATCRRGERRHDAVVSGRIALASARCLPRSRLGAVLIQPAPTNWASSTRTRRGEARRVGSEIRAPDTLVDAIFHAAADVGSIPTASAAAHASCRSLKRTQPDRQRFVLVGEWRLDVGRVGGDFHAGVTPECLVDQYPQLKPR